VIEPARDCPGPGRWRPSTGAALPRVAARMAAAAGPAWAPLHHDQPEEALLGCHGAEVRSGWRVQFLAQTCAPGAVTARWPS